MGECPLWANAPRMSSLGGYEGRRGLAGNTRAERWVRSWGRFGGDLGEISLTVAPLPR